MIDNTDKIAGRFLGKKVGGSNLYDPSLLVAVPREDNRKQYNLDNKNLPFTGWDVWQAYEFSTMTDNGIPITRLMKMKYNCESNYIVESKSLKLYLNSFNMTRFGKNISECLEICKGLIKKDLSEKLETEVDVNFIEPDAKRIDIFAGFRNIMDYIDENSLRVESFKEAPGLLETEEKDKIEEYYLMFDSLRSNCRVTHQPDFGDVYIYYKSLKHMDEGSLVKYLSSFRSEFHFHEECCEMIYKRLYDILDKDDRLFVCALYTRRGGIDISPSRWSRNCPVHDVLTLLDVNKFARSGIKQ